MVQTDKYTQNAEHREILRSTEREVLVGFAGMRPDDHVCGGEVRGGAKRSQGLVEGGGLVGRNSMGNCLMAVRAALQRFICTLVVKKVQRSCWMLIRE